MPFARDPHAAQMLVERMQRMHDRGGGHIDWAVGTPATSTLPPESQALLAAAAAAAAVPKDDVAPVPAEIVRPPREVPRPQRDLTDSTLKGPPRRRRGGIFFLAAAAILGIAIGLAIFAVGNRGDGDGAPVADPGPVPPGRIDPPAPTAVKVAVPPDQNPPERDARASTSPVPPAVPSVTIKKPVIGADELERGGPAVKKRPGVKGSKDDRKEIVKPVDPPQPPKPACDVYADPHRCQT